MWYARTNLVKWVCLHCTIAAYHAHWNTQSHKLSLKVVFLCQSFLVITVVQLKFIKISERQVNNEHYFDLKSNPDE